MQIEIKLTTDEAIALRRLANEQGVKLPDAAEAALRDWLIGNGYLEMADELEEDTETAGEA